MASVARTVSIVALLLLGGSGTLAGLQLAGAMAAAGSGSGSTKPGILIGAGMAAYGVVLLAAAIGMLTGRRWGRPLGLAGIAAGLALLVALLAVAGRDEILLGGVAGWAITLVCLALAKGPDRPA